MTKEELKPIDVSKYTVTESGNVIKGEEKETTNKELEKRAFAEADKVVIGKGMDISSVVHLRHLLKNMYVGGAISETKVLSQHILELQADKGELTDKVKELEAQIEKMKCCQNCKHCAKIHDYDLDNEEDDNIEFCEVRCHERSGWELKEIEK